MRAFRILLLISFLSAACSKRLVDLSPAAPSGGTDLTALCDRDEKGRLVVRIRNRGNRESRASTTMVQFESYPPSVLPTRPVAPGGEAVVSLTLADECLQGGCRFTIRVDARQEVAETDESNNEIRGRCGG